MKMTIIDDSYTNPRFTVRNFLEKWDSDKSKVSLCVYDIEEGTTYSSEDDWELTKEYAIKEWGDWLVHSFGIDCDEYTNNNPELTVYISTRCIIC